MAFSQEERQRYSRQFVLKEIGLEGQGRLREARICVAGVGGLGCISAPQLAGMGVGSIRLVDQDVVDLTNLHRQTLYDTASIGYPKVEVAAKRLKALNPNIEVEPIPLTINDTTAENIVNGVDLVVDGLDRFSPRYALNRACVKLKVPYVFGGAIEAYGNVSTVIPGETACLECIVGRLSDEGLPTCERVGVLPSILGVIASIEVREALNLILGQKPSLANKLLFCDINDMSFEVFQVAKAGSCQTCGGTALPLMAEEPKVVELCGERSFMVSPRQPAALDMTEATNVLGTRFKVRIKAQFGITFNYSDDVSISLMKTGNMLVKGVVEKQDALRLYDEVIKLLPNQPSV